MTSTRVIVVDDSLTVRRRICAVLDADPDIEVVGQAGDGKEAISRCIALRPDVITMDMMLPVMSGLAATEYVMAHCPTPILIVSSSVNRGEMFKTLEALAAGAVDVLEKPRGDASDESWERRLTSTVKLVARIRVITHPRARLNLSVVPDPTDPPDGCRGAPARTFPRARGPVAVAAIGASTGGPGAIVEVLRGLPATFTVPLLLVLHIGQPFGQAFADWLDGQTERRVRHIHDGEPLGNFVGSVAMAPPDHHLVVREEALYMTRDPERHSCRPSVDVLFESVALSYGTAAAGCLLTGMGRDGAAGLSLMRNLGGLTIAQDEATSVVYGMPREAVLLDAVDHVLPLGQIGPTLAHLVGAREHAHRS
jgi:two-component system chemotaxis response regulator CheB